MSLAPEPASAGVRAWDLPTRLFHWTLVLLIFSAWLSYVLAEDVGDVTLVWHRVNGLAVLILIVWRLLWGIAGSSTARFGFVRAPSAVLAYARTLVDGRAARYLGHNPLGALMVVALVVAVGVVTALGLFATDDNDLVGGPLYRLGAERGNVLATPLHDRLFHVLLLPRIAVHVTVNVLYGLVKREPLIRAMITGRKPLAPYADAAEATVVAHPLMRAAVCLAAATAIVLGGILLMGGRLAL
jgi:cytochrome b